MLLIQHRRVRFPIMAMHILRLCLVREYTARTLPCKCEMLQPGFFFSGYKEWPCSVHAHPTPVQPGFLFSPHADWPCSVYTRLPTPPDLIRTLLIWGLLAWWKIKNLIDQDSPDLECGFTRSLLTQELCKNRPFTAEISKNFAHSVRPVFLSLSVLHLQAATTVICSYESTVVWSRSHVIVSFAHSSCAR